MSSYYKSSSGKLSAIDFIEEFNLSFNLGNVIKYVARAGRKPGESMSEALEKALWYLSRETEKAEMLELLEEIKE